MPVIIASNAECKPNVFSLTMVRPWSLPDLPVLSDPLQLQNYLGTTLVP